MPGLDGIKTRLENEIYFCSPQVSDMPGLDGIKTLKTLIKLVNISSFRHARFLLSKRRKKAVNRPFALPYEINESIFAPLSATNHRETSAAPQLNKDEFDLGCLYQTLALA